MEPEEDVNIFVAASDGLLDRVQALVASGTDINSQDAQGYSAIHAAASYGNVDVLKWLLEHGGRVDLADADGDTPLHACETAECADLLLAHGAALALVNKEGLTPYHIAVTECRDEMVDWLGKRYTDRGMTLPEVVHESDGDAGDEVEDD